MGIPSYFVHIVKKHNNIIKKFQAKNITIHNLYIDSNSIIYDGIKAIAYKNDNATYEIKLIKWVCEKISYYINLITPTNKVYIAFDGVAPVAKLEQQKNRRYKSWFINNYISNTTDTVNDRWDTTAVTPGTEFMEKLYKGITGYFNEIKTYEIIISGSNYAGEGEHKIYKYIRDNKRYHHDTNTVIYGLDADLIMLTLIHTKISANLYLFRETPHFISSIDNNLIPDEHYVMDIYELGERLNEQMSSDDCILDYIFICFMLGNDFMPHFPALNIRTNGITILLETYNHLFGKFSDALIKNNKIQWKNLRKFIEELSKSEEQFCIDEMKLKDKHEKNISRRQFKNEEEKLMACPMYDRKVEKYINIGEVGWQERYYKELFGIEINDARRKQICINYLEGLEWNLKYYIKDCPDWKWKYNYKYPPLLQDLYKFIPYFDTEFIETKLADPVHPLVQLSYVLPRNSLHLLPPSIYENLILNHSEWYQLDYEIVWAYCKYFWESHIILPHIDINILEKLVTNNQIIK
jgi:5'-3' exonuclease